MATISNNSLIQPVYVAELSQMASVAKVAGRLYYIADINALWLCTNDAAAAPSVSNGVYTAGGGTFFGLASGSALVGSNASPSNLGNTKPTGVPIIDTSWLPGTVNEIVEVFINRNVALSSADLFKKDALGFEPIVGAAKTIYLVIGQTTVPPNTNNYASKINHSFRWSGSQFVDLDNDQFTLDELTNVTISSPTNNQVLTYEAATSTWKNKAVLPDTLLGLSTLGIVLRTGVNTYSTRTLGTANNFLRMNAAGTGLEWHSLNVGVTSVGLTMPSGFSVTTPNPITSTGTFGVSITGPIKFANPVTTGTPSIILGKQTGSDSGSVWNYIIGPNSGFTQYGANFYGASAFAPTDDPGTGATTYHFQTMTNIWRVRTGASGDTWTTVSSGFTSGTTLPASPGNGDVFYKTNATQGIYIYISGVDGVVDGSLYFNETLGKIRIGVDGQYKSILDEDDIANLYWVVVV